MPDDMPSRAPVRVERKGFARVFAPSREEFKRACAWAASDVRRIVWLELAELQQAVLRRMIDQLRTPALGITLAGRTIDDGSPVLVVFVPNKGMEEEIEIRATEILRDGAPLTLDAPLGGGDFIRQKIEELAKTAKAGVMSAVDEVKNAPRAPAPAPVAAKAAAVVKAASSAPGKGNPRR